ncbi:NADH:flavin oxidoreductase/NADH oxidase family protein [Pseudomonas paeninsulae]|uniref:NADH:flavin oxidoreductase/NADH oxidase family protein n=1 Tax=Pseudomonas paeninsulae TaxID=3110772 RepID=UPI002D79FBF2|nr:NADH:flavin oxidoreductase/NADH oxidase family protein [Pseudomonas sp. IT1137]
MTQPTTKHDFSGPENVLGRPLELPCGVVLKNRLMKSAMSDSLGDGKGNATAAQARLYERWAEGGAALSLIGEVQGDPRYPEKPGNLVLGPNTDQKALRSLARRGSTEGAHLWPQLGHAGALAHLPISRAKGPSSLDIEGLQCAGMTLEDIGELPGIYARAATIAKGAGFGGVQIHAGHGFLLSQFLSPLFNRRTDGYGGSIEARFRIVHEVIEAVRQAVGASFPIAIKINSTDKLQGGLTEDEAMEVVRILDQTSIDLIDISGGTYFPGAAASSDSTSGSGPYFLDFARRAKQATAIPIMATGGFKTRQQAVDAVESGAVDMVSVGRAMALNPHLARDWLSVGGGDPAFPKFDTTPPGGVTAWYTMRLTALAEDNEDEFSVDLESAMSLYDVRDAERCDTWRKAFARLRERV